MSAFGDVAETRIMGWLLTAGAVTRPASWFVGLHTADPGETGSTAELVGSGYARTAASFTVTGSTAQNSGVVSFGPATANWTAATHFSVWDASSGGNCLMKGLLQASVTVNTGDSAQFAAGALSLSVD